MSWTTPSYAEIDMSAEIGSYESDWDGPDVWRSLVAARPDDPDVPRELSLRAS